MSVWTLAGMLIVGSGTATATDTCLERAKTDLERAYCNIVSAGEGAGLPAFEDFRRNDGLVQALLLKRPAERLGLKLPGRQHQPPSIEPVTASASRPEAPRPARPGPIGERPTGERSSVERSSDSRSPGSVTADCRFSDQGETIVCTNGHYALAANKQNAALNSRALDDANRLDLRSYQGRRSDDAAVIHHLSDAYAVYVSKMLGIGLGAATLSFTEFHHAFHTTEAAGVDFARRSEETFQRLKSDRRTMAVQSRLHNELPGSIEACMDISSDIIVCDNVGTNWVYVRASR